jgi:homospermidine synthase
MRGLVEPEHMDFDRVLQLSTPYLGHLVGVYNSEWSPLWRRNTLFKEPHLDTADPWQFQNFRVL